ncbi:uncharacterized protein LOC123680302 isoform X1 [Harmonia axyridis]|uniref:uncharacterized protein LOC123680302 isoform X1 n=1 Tax=Harmonia axyridis TaxID=115357 RepID=UPI001E27670C|nr:uncharacterized protein LOC123680302 isoform X1 [Harmonia axyridis]
MANYFYEYLKGYKAFIMPLELFDDITFKKVVFIINMIKIICSLNMVLATIAALGFISAPKYFNEKTYLLVWIFENFPTHSNIMAKFVHWTSLPVALVLAGTSLVWTYAGMNGVFQVALLKRMIATITTSTIQHKYRRDSPLYQETTKQKMIICIMTHEILVRYQNIACDLFEAPMMMFAMGSVVLGGALMIEFLSNQALDLGDQYTIYIGIVCFAMAGGISAMLYLIIGQVLKDESEACNYQLRQLPWYDMNSENMKIYSFFLLKTERCVSLSNSLIQLDCILLMRIIKALYSIATLLAQFVASNYSA